MGMKNNFIKVMDVHHDRLGKYEIIIIGDINDGDYVTRKTLVDIEHFDELLEDGLYSFEYDFNQAEDKYELKDSLLELVPCHTNNNIHSIVSIEINFYQEYGRYYKVKLTKKEEV